MTKKVDKGTVPSIPGYHYYYLEGNVNNLSHVSELGKFFVNVEFKKIFIREVPLSGKNALDVFVHVLQKVL